MANKRDFFGRLARAIVLALVIGFLAPIAGLRAEPVSLSVRNAAVAQARMAARSGGEVCLSTLLNAGRPPFKVDGTTAAGFQGIKGNIRMIVGGRNYTAADVDAAEVPFYTLNGYGLTPLLHDGGQWPGTGGNTDNDDGYNTSGSNQAAEIFDVDGNNHYPRGVLRYIGSHCYIFVPWMYYPTLPRGVSSTEEQTPAPLSSWGLYWPDSAGSGEKIYYAAASGARTLDPRFVLGMDKNLARLKLKELADEFDNIIYPKIREYYGTEPDVDQDGKIFILLDDIRDGVGSFRGYFWSANQYPRTQISTSNEKELLYIDLFPTYLTNPKGGYGTIAHEFTHMVIYNEGQLIENGEMVEKERWLEEGMTQYGQYLYNQTHTTNLDEFIKDPDTILVEPRISVWLGNSPFANYGASYLFMFYLMEKYGRSTGPTFMRNLVRDQGRGLDSINNALRGFNTTFDQVFSDWAIANFLDKTRKLDGSPLNDGKWGYALDNDYDTANNLGNSQSLPVKFAERVILGPKGTARSSNVMPWSADYIEITGNNGNLNVGFDGDDRSTFKAAIIKRGAQVDPSVELMYLNDRQQGNLIIQNYGTGNTYDNLVLVPMVVSSGNYEKQTYVYSGTFSDLKVAVFPNPVFENDLHILVRTNDSFAATPRLQMTYNNEQGYLVMAPISSSTFITNYRLKESGEGQIEAFGTNNNGTILTNVLKFSAVYYPARSEGALKASFASLEFPRGALRNAGLVTLAADQAPVSWPGLQRIGQTLMVGLPVSEADAPITIRVPLATGVVGQLGLFESTNAGPKFVARCERAGNQVIASVKKGGEYFVAADLSAPVIKAEVVESTSGKVLIDVSDTGSGVDPDSIKVSYEGRPLPAVLDAAVGKIVVQSGSLRDGDYRFDVKLADRFGNAAEARIAAQVLAGNSLAQAIVYPSPARTMAKLRCAFNGGAGVVGVEATIRDTSGDEVWWGGLKALGGGMYETTWDLRNSDRKAVANGVYIVEFKAYAAGEELTQRRKLAVLR